MGFLGVVTTFLIGLPLWTLVALARNYIIARKIGLPMLITPLDPMNPIWALTEKRFSPLLKYLSSHLPYPLCSLFDWVHYSNLGWFYDSKYTLHARFGSAFIIVSPQSNWVIYADAAAAESVLARRKDFIKPREMYQPLEIFGPNVDSVNGENWARHRRITTSIFTERNSSLVWGAGLDQASELLKSWSRTAANGIGNVPDQMMALTLKVFTIAGSGERPRPNDDIQDVSTGHTMSYMTALDKVLGNFLIAFLLGRILVRLPDWVLLKSLAEIKHAVIEFKMYMVEMLARARDNNDAMAKGQEGGSDHLISVLLKASDHESGELGRSGLSDEEIMGNMFIYNFAGHDTTANTLAYAITMLASDLRWQNWIAEELDSVFGGKESLNRSDYEQSFPQLKRCLALMQETLRIYGPVFFIPRQNEEATELMIDEVKYTIPPKTFIVANVAGLHARPSYWGADALVWRPDRWLDDGQELIQPSPGTFIPWSSGPRVCPGKKFSQIEFVAVIAKLFQKNRVRPQLEVNEQVEEAGNRVRNVADDSELVMTLKMRDPERIKLLWEAQK